MPSPSAPHGDDLELASVLAECPRHRGGPPGPPRCRGLGRGRSLGGTVVATQDSLGTVVADVPAAALDRLRTSPAVRAVTEDSRLQMQSLGLTPTAASVRPVPPAT